METIRALMVHSAEWTPAMISRIEQAGTKKQAIVLARHFGYGVPNLQRALASAENDLFLLAQRGLRPYRRTRGETEEGLGPLKSPSFRQIDCFNLP